MAKQKASLPNEQDAYWQKYLEDNRSKEGDRLEDAAKFLSGMISISLTIFLKMNETAFKEVASTWFLGVVVVVVLWLLALAGAFFVFFPFKYQYNKDSTSSIKAFHEQMVKRKRRLLLGSTLCFFVGLVVLGGLYFFV